jgi:hypothetical protein
LIFFQKKIKKLKCLIVNVATEPWAWNQFPKMTF